MIYAEPPIGSELPIWDQKEWSEHGKVWSAGPEKAAYTDTIQVVPRQSYLMKLEVLQSDLSDSDEKVSGIEINGESLGECNPDGGDQDCTFFDCAQHLLTNEIVSEDSSLQVKLTFQKHSKDCNCNKRTWNCKSDAEKDPTKASILAAARITLTPLGNSSSFQIQFDLCLINKT